MSVFDVDINVLTKQLMPVRLRQPRSLAWLGCLVSPVRYVLDLFNVSRSADLYVLAHNGQICYLEAALNDTFDPVNRRIYIADGIYVDPVFVYLETELKPVYLDLESEIGTGVIPSPDPVSLYKDAEVYAGVGEHTFIVNVPVSVMFDVARLKALVDMYKLPGKKYNIVTY